MAEIYKGIFWFKDISTANIVCAKIPCFTDGSIKENIDASLNSKHGNNFNHEKTWNSFDRNITEGKKYNYYPRGRVEIKNGKAKIFINPNIFFPRVIECIMDEFGLDEENGITEINVNLDYSKHYKCYLDQEER